MRVYFTQTTWDKEGFAIRDPASTTYVGAIETAQEFGPRLYPDGTTASSSYDGTGHVTASTDQAGKVTHYAFDDSGQMKSVTDALSQMTSYAYDNNALLSKTAVTLSDRTQ